MPKPEEQETKSTLTISKSENGRVAKISIEGDIAMDWWGLSYQDVKRQVERESSMDVLEVDIFSDGGSVTDGMGMYRILLDSPNTVHTYVNAFAGSIATVVQMAGDKMFVADNAMVMIHNPMGVAFMSNADDMRKEADVLDKFGSAMRKAYMRHFKGTEDELSTLLSAETYLTAQEFSEKFNNVTVLSSGGAKMVAHRNPVAYMGSMELPKEAQGKQSLGQKIFSKVRAKSAEKPKPKEETDTMSITPEEMQGMATAMVSALQSAGVVAAKKEEVATPVPEAPEAPTAEDPEVDVPFEGDKSKLGDIQAHREKVLVAKAEAKVDWNDCNSIATFEKFVASRTATAAVPKTNTDPSPVALGSSVVAKKEVDTAFIDKYAARLNGGSK